MIDIWEKDNHIYVTVGDKKWKLRASNKYDADVLIDEFVMAIRDFDSDALVESLDSHSSFVRSELMTKSVSIDLYDVLRSIQGCAGEEINLDMVRKLMQKDELFYEVLEYGASDTVVREHLLNELSLQLTGIAWPTYGDSEGVKKEHEEKWANALAAAKNG